MTGTTTMKRGASLAAIAALIGVAAPLTMMGGSAQAKAGDVKSGPSRITASARLRSRWRMGTPR